MSAFTQLGWQHAVDFIVLAATLYLLLSWANEARAVRIVLTIAGLYAASLLARSFSLIVTAWALEAGAIVILLLLVLLFQPELRRALMHLDSRLHLRANRLPVLESVYETVAEAAFSLAATRTGALIVFAHKQSIQELVEHGVTIGAEVNKEIIEAIFQKQSPIHDGAIVIEGDRITQANMVLPLTQRAGVPTAFGTRHRAAMGLAERCDATVIVVSEERGEVRVVRGCDVDEVGEASDLVHRLAQPMRRRPRRLAAARHAITSNVGLKLAAIALASIIWGLSVLSSDVVRIAIVPVEFDGVPPGMRVENVSSETLEVELRGRPWLMTAANLSRLVFHFDLSNARQGLRVIPARREGLDLPPGINVEDISPPSINVRIEPAGPR